jgi:U3 small nucleolar RNA-associated protein 6
LETLRRHRKKVQNAAQPAAEETEQQGGRRPPGGRRGRAPHGVSGAGDHAVVQRIHFLYTRALRKFRGDLRLWVRVSAQVQPLLLWARPLTSRPPLVALCHQARLFAFCRAHGGNKALSKSLVAALALHPTNPGLWAYAASWELRGRRDLHSARTLMQRGLRACPQSPDLWADYFSLELVAANLLRQRASVLGLPTHDDVTPEGDQAAAAEEVTLDDGVDEQPAAPGAATTATQERARLRRGRAALMRGAVAVAVFDAACAARPGDVQLCLRCLAAAKAAGAWAAEPVVGHILGSLATGDVAKHPEAVTARAQAAGSYTQGVAVFEAALAADPSPGVATAYGAWLQAADPQLGDGAGAALEALARRAMRERIAQEALLLTAVRVLVAVGRRDASAALCRDAVAVVPKSVHLWGALLRSTASDTSGAVRPGHLAQLCVSALQAVPPSDAAPLWVEALQLCTACGAPGDITALHTALATAHARGAGPALSASAATALRVCGASQAGMAAARALCDTLVKLPGMGPEVFVTALQLEAAALRSIGQGVPHDGASRTACLARARALAEAAVTAHGASSSAVWRACIALETDASAGEMGSDTTPGHTDRVAKLLWRCRRALGDPQALSDVSLA